MSNGASSDDDRATHEPSQEVVSALRVGIPCAMAREAMDEALRRYPDSHDALAFFWVASGLAMNKPNAAQIEWARDKVGKIKARGDA